MTVVFNLCFFDFYTTSKGKLSSTVNVVVWDGIYPYRRWRHFPDWGPPPPPRRPPVHSAPPAHPVPPRVEPAPAPNHGHNNPPNRGTKAPNAKPIYR